MPKNKEYKMVYFHEINNKILMSYRRTYVLNNFVLIIIKLYAKVISNKRYMYICTGFPYFYFKIMEYRKLYHFSIINSHALYLREKNLQKS